jgi:uncharacterized protein (DUF4213/DUF364 family)
MKVAPTESVWSKIENVNFPNLIFCCYNMGPGRLAVGVIDDLLFSICSDSPDVPVKGVWVGLRWTAVHSLSLGLAANLLATDSHKSEAVSNAGLLQELSAYELAAYLRSENWLDVIVGMAALNSLVVVDERRAFESNARELLLRRGRDKKVALVGHFSFTEELRQVAARLWVLELRPGPGDYPAQAAPELLPQAEVIALTATTLMNGTFDGLSGLFPPEALVVMLGPSTPLSRVLFDYGVDVLSGTQVVDPATTLRYIGQGGSLRRVPGIRRLNIARDRSVWAGD